MIYEQTYNCTICNTEINTPESKMIIDRDEYLKTKGILCLDCHCTVYREDPSILLQAVDYVLSGGYPEQFEDDDGELPRPKKIRRGLTEQDRDFLEQLIGKREFTTRRDDEFSIPKLKGRKKATPNKKPATGNNRQGENHTEEKGSPADLEIHQSELAA